MVGATGFEPATSRTRTVRSTRLSHAPTLGPTEPWLVRENLTQDRYEVNHAAAGSRRMRAAKKPSVSWR